jgi:hypothetical protein
MEPSTPSSVTSAESTAHAIGLQRESEQIRLELSRIGATRDKLVSHIQQLYQTVGPDAQVEDQQGVAEQAYHHAIHHTQQLATIAKEANRRAGANNQIEAEHAELQAAYAALCEEYGEGRVSHGSSDKVSYSSDISADDEAKIQQQKRIASLHIARMNTCPSENSPATDSKGLFEAGLNAVLKDYQKVPTKWLQQRQEEVKRLAEGLSAGPSETDAEASASRSGTTTWRRRRPRPHSRPRRPSLSNRQSMSGLGKPVGDDKISSSARDISHRYNPSPSSQLEKVMDTKIPQALPEIQIPTHTKHKPRLMDEELAEKSEQQRPGSAARFERGRPHAIKNLQKTQRSQSLPYHPRVYQEAIPHFIRFQVFAWWRAFVYVVVAFLRICRLFRAGRVMIGRLNLDSVLLMPFPSGSAIIVATHCIWIACAQMFVACWRERQIWLEGNGLTRKYMLEYIHQYHSSWILLGVDWKLAWGADETAAVLCYLTRSITNGFLMTPP